MWLGVTLLSFGNKTVPATWKSTFIDPTLPAKLRHIFANEGSPPVSQQLRAIGIELPWPHTPTQSALQTLAIDCATKCLTTANTKEIAFQ
jgi:hypothetical protein